ncbi:MAG TPA: hypothetical protein DCY13_11625 [Verrucomicrobiales bacterium]|nr:hypothetical protein [Verrucomicrobiales bacterium]
MKLPRNAKVFRGQLDVAPFMGVFLLLLLFVMLQQQIAHVPGLRVQLPAGADVPGIRGPAVAVVMDSSGRLYFDNQQVTATELREQLRLAANQMEEPVSLIVRADQRVSLGAWTDLNLMARQVGIREVLLAINPPAAR